MNKITTAEELIQFALDAVCADGFTRGGCFCTDLVGDPPCSFKLKSECRLANVHDCDHNICNNKECKKFSHSSKGGICGKFSTHSINGKCVLEDEFSIPEFNSHEGGPNKFDRVYFYEKYDKGIRNFVWPDAIVLKGKIRYYKEGMAQAFDEKVINCEETSPEQVPCSFKWMAYFIAIEDEIFGTGETPEEARIDLYNQFFSIEENETKYLQ